MGTGLKPLNHFRLKAVLWQGRLVRIIAYSWKGTPIRYLLGRAFSPCL